MAQYFVIYNTLDYSGGYQIKRAVSSPLETLEAAESYRASVSPDRNPVIVTTDTRVAEVL